MKLVPRSGTWQVHFTDPSGTRHRLSTRVRVNPNLPDRGKAQANLAALDVMRESLLGDLPPDARKQAGKHQTLGYALQRTLDELWSKQKGRRERKYVVGRLIAEVGYWPLQSVTYTRLEQYGREMEAEKLAPATRNRRMSAIHTAMTHAKRRGELEILPEFPTWPENNVKERYLSTEEEAKLAASMAARAAPADEKGQYMRRLVPFLLDTGLRAGEVRLKPDQDLGHAIWLPHGSTKSGKGRVVPLTTRARAMLDFMLASPFHAELVSLGEKSPELATHRLGSRFRIETDQAGIQGVTLHTLRHTCASRLVQGGVDLYVVKEWLGHSSITVTERYAHLAPKNLALAAGMLEGLPSIALAPEVGTEPAPRASVH
jgi:integrase